MNDQTKPSNARGRMTESPTPQTDELLYTKLCPPPETEEEVLQAITLLEQHYAKFADFARTLERENIELRAKLEAAEKLLAANEGRVKEIVDEHLLQRAERAEAALRERNVNAERYEWLLAIDSARGKS